MSTIITIEQKEARIEQASLDGNLSLLESLVNGFLKPHQKLWWEVSEKAVSHVHVLKWIYQRDKRISPDIWKWQYKYGSIESAEWLVQHIGHSYSSSYSFQQTFSKGNIEMFFWLFQKVNESNASMSIKDVLDNLHAILKNGEVKLLEELMVRHSNIRDDLMNKIRFSMSSNNIGLSEKPCLKRQSQMAVWLMHHHISMPSRLMIAIDDLKIWQEIHSKNLVNDFYGETITLYYENSRERQTSLSLFEKSTIWLLDHGYTVSSNVWNNLAYYGDIVRLNWFYETCTARNIPVTLDSYLYSSPVIAHHYGALGTITIEKVFEVLQWLFNRGCSLNNIQICQDITKTGNLSLLQWVITRGAPWDEVTSVLIAQNGNLEMLQWAIDHGCPWGERTVFYAMNHLNVFKYLIEEKQASFQPEHEYCDKYPYSSTTSLETFLWTLENRREYCIWKNLVHSTTFLYRQEDMMHHREWEMLQIALRNSLLDPLEIAKIVVRTCECVIQILQDVTVTRYHWIKTIPNKRWQMIATLTDVLNRLAIVYQLGFMKSGFSEKLIDDVSKNPDQLWRKSFTWDWQIVKRATDEVMLFNAQSIIERQCRLDSFYERMFYPYRLFQNSWQKYK